VTSTSKITILPNDEAVLAIETKNIRNIYFLGHIDAGRSTIIDRILGEVAQPSNSRSYRDWQSAHVAFQHAEERYLINIMNPRYPNDPSQVQYDTSADSALVVIDCCEGFAVQAETLLRKKILTQKLKPILFLNKIDRLMTDYGMDGEKIYQSLLKIIEAINRVISETNEDWTFDPCKGNVIFGAITKGWCFTLASYSKIWAQKLDVSQEKLQEKLWGESYYHKETNKWQSEPSGESTERGFVRFLLNPIQKLSQTLLEGDASKIENATSKLGIQLSPEEIQCKGNFLLRAAFSKFLNPVDCLLKTFVEQLPSPQEAQKYRAGLLYQGSEDKEDDICLKSIQDCDPNGPLMIGISRLAPSSRIDDTGPLVALGRIFSGTVKPGQKVFILDVYHKRGKKDYFTEKVKNVRLGTIEAKEGVSAGNMVWLEGLEKFVMQNGTITDYEQASPIYIGTQKLMEVVQVEVKPKKASDLPKLYEALREISRRHFCVKIAKEESGKIKIKSSSNEFLDVILYDLKYSPAIQGFMIETSEILPCYQETVTQKSNQDCTISDDHSNALSLEACPLSEDVLSSIEKGTFNFEPARRAQILIEEFKWDAQTTENLWAFGPETTHTNILVNMATSKGSEEALNKIQESVVAGFQWATSEGVLIGENMNGVRLNILNAAVSADSSHREPAKIISLARKVCLASELTAQPRLREPISVVEVWTPVDKVYNVCKALEPNGEVFEENVQENGMLTIVKAYLPISEAVTLQAKLRVETQGQASASYTFDHWKLIEEDPLDKSSNAYKIVSNIRTQKGLKDDLNIQYFKLTPFAY